MVRISLRSAVPRRSLPTILAVVLVAVAMGAVLDGSPLGPGTARADHIQFDPEPGVPYGVHLSFTQDPQTTMTVTWFTAGPDDPGTVVEWGPSPDGLTETVQGGAKELLLSDDLVHHATITGLQPGQEFCYRAGGPGGANVSGGFSQVWCSHTAPPAGDPFRVVSYGDQGLSDNALAVRDGILALDPPADLVLIAGDLSYAEGDPERWDRWFDNNEPLLATTPMMAAVGNHEAISPFGTRPYQERHAFPAPEIYYSFDYANVHIVSFQADTVPSHTEGVYAPMVRFVEQDLREAHARKQAGEIDHIAFLQHHPIYSNTARFDRRLDPDLAAVQEQWFHRYGVKLLVTGHNHNYERTFPMAYGVPTTTQGSEYVDPAGWIEVVSGGGGAGLYDFVHPDDFLPYSADHARRHHFTVYDIEGETISVTSISADLLAGQVIDTFTLTDTTGPSAREPVARTDAAAAKLPR